jgi:ABC-type phosphate transport system auxiliary subunit
LGFLPLTIEALRLEKPFIKLVKRQQKDVDVTKKRHAKERSALQKQHCIVFDKMAALHDREKSQQEKNVERATKKKGSVKFHLHFFLCERIT